MPLHPAVRDRLSRLAPDQRAAATAPPGPVLCVAPAGSGKTTTLVARVAWLIDGGHPASRICVVTFNRRAAVEVRERLAAALEPLGVAADEVRVRTFHALAREVLAEAGRPVAPLVDRTALLVEMLGPRKPDGLLRMLDDAFSRLKLDAGLDAAAAERLCRSSREEAGAARSLRVMRAFLAYEAELRRRGALDFDDLVRNAVRLLETEATVRSRWHALCGHLLVDEVQDLDRSQLRLALLLASPEYRLFLVGDDDQTIYAWRLADVRRILGLATNIPGLGRVDLVTNYRSPAPVVSRAVRLVEHNRERFDKEIRPRPGATGGLFLVPDSGDDVARARRLLRRWPPPDGGRAAVLARTNAELVPFAAAAVELETPFFVEDDGLCLDARDLDRLLGLIDRVEANDGREPVPDGPRSASARLLRALGRIGGEDPETRRLAGGLIGWAPAAERAVNLRAALTEATRRRGILRREDARLVLATVHGTKGLEFDHVAVVGLDDGRFPSARSITEAVDPRRTLEEERRLAYVAWTRARRSLALVYDPGAPSQFIREAFDRRELRAAESLPPP